MIRHIVIFKLAQSYNAGEKKDAVIRLHEIFGPLGSKLGFPLEYRIGINILDSENAGDVVIDSLFASVEDLKRYQASREHQDAVAEASEIRKTKTVIDYEV